jgi:hypothetical protein
MRLKVTTASALAALLTIAAPAWCADSAPSGAQDSAAAAAPADGAAAPQKAHPIRAALSKLSPARLLDSKLFQRAEHEFPAFCKDWESKLKEREHNNVSHVSWKVENGEEVGSYVGYGNVQSCTCKQSSKGIPVGKLTYQEFEYKLEGKTLDEAEHAKPQQNGITNTTEIFRWDKKQDKWIY